VSGHVHITPELVQAVRDAVDIADIAAEHTKLRRAGRRSTGLCPLHKEKTPSFSVDSERGLFYCFGCGQGGDAIRLHMLLSGDDFPAAIESLARRYGIPLPTRPSRSRGREEPDLEPVLLAAEEFFRERLREEARPRKYLEDRKIGAELIEQYRLGWAPDGWQGLVDAVGPRFPMKQLEAAGLVSRSEKNPDRPYDRFRERLMFPIRDASGRLVGFGGRTLGDDKAKYINTAETSRFRKGTLLYGLDSAKRSIREEGRALLVEGYFDLLGAAAAGIEWAVASMGTALTQEQCRLLARFTEEVVVGYDGDAAGENAYRRALPVILGHDLGVRRLVMEEGQDPDSLRLEEGPEGLVERVEASPDAVLHEIERLLPKGGRGEPREQAKAAREITELLGAIPDGVLRFGYARQAAERMGVPIDLIWKRMGGRGAAEPRKEGTKGAPGRHREIVRSLEERLLHVLLSGSAPLPPPESLPPEDAFLDPTCRNIFASFLALYRDGGPEPPAPTAVLERLGEEGGSIDRVARILLEGPTTPGSDELRESLGQLERRWRQQELRRLSSEISEAQRVGDGVRLAELLEEKTALSRRLHDRGADGEDAAKT
jgi:DNA primase